jgi:hypothetical protein
VPEGGQQKSFSKRLLGPGNTAYMDTFCTGDAAYHALSVIECGLPRSYMIKQCRNDINKQFVIRRTQGDLIGAQMSFKEELRRKIKGNIIHTLQSMHL